jgi:hypothetical protein
MRHMRSLPGLMLALALAVAACGSSTTSEGTTSSAASSAPAALASVVPVAPSGAVTCADADMAAANFRTYVHYASLNVGTMNDSVPTYGDMAVALGVLTAAAPTCMPDAADEIAALTAAAQDAAAAFQPSEDPAAIATQKQALTALRDAGATAWTAMGMNPADWDLTLQFTE